MPCMGPSLATDEQVEKLYDQFIEVLHKNQIQRFIPFNKRLKENRVVLNNRLKELVRELINQENYECF